MISSEDLASWKEIVAPVAAAISTLGTGFLAYMQSKCRRDLDIAYGEIRYLKTGRRTVRKKGQFWRRKKNRKLVEIDKGISDHNEDEKTG